jgi:formylglycine-generating enzyme required for sulfatase activity
MFRHMFTAALAALAQLGSFSLAIAQGPRPPGGEKQITNSIGMTLTLIPSGEFMMGTKESVDETAQFFIKNYHAEDLKEIRLEDEHPLHQVRITKPFYLGTYHVTRGQFSQFVKDSGYKTDAEKPDSSGIWGWDSEKKTMAVGKEYSWRNTGFQQADDHPVVNVSWNDAVAFCRWLSRKDGKTYRLPTEAEWEYACRAGTTTRYYNGDDPEMLAKVGNVADATARTMFPNWKWTIQASDGYVFTAPVGKFSPNAFGLNDMHGNAWQWCADWYDGTYYRESPVNDPKGPDTGRYLRVCRGGSWGDGPLEDRSDARAFAPQNNCLSGKSGFRVARTQ